MYDITIIGAGPSGATLARLLGKNYKVLLIEKRNLDTQANEKLFEKCCGGLLAPDAQEILAKFGLGLPKEVMVGPQLFAVKVIDIPNKAEAYYQRHYINVDREKFDRWMVSIIPDQVEFRFKSIFKNFEVGNDKIKVNFNINGTQYSEYTKILVGADGALSRIRKAICPDKNSIKTYVSIQEWFETQEILPFFSAIFDEEVTDFYSWIIPKENHNLLGSALLLNSNADSKFELLKMKLSDLGFNFSKKVKRNGSYILRPENLNHIYSGNNRVALIGEAAGFISPSSAEGLSYGFSSAISLANAINDSFESFAGKYYHNLKDLRNNIKMKNLKSPCMYNPQIRSAIVKSGFKSLKILGS